MNKTFLLSVRASVVIALCGAIWLRSGPPVSAQSGITITSPANGVVLAAGPDFASDTLSDPWDFSNREDVTLDPAQIDGFSNFTVAGGLAGGTLSTTRLGHANGSNFYLLQRAYWGILNPGRTGRATPIAPAYSKLAFKMSSTRGDQFPRVYWFHNDLGDPGGDAAGWRFIDTMAPAPAGNNIFVVDLTQANNAVPWSSGAVKGFGFYPNSSTVGYPVQFDWVRLTTGDGSAASKIVPVTWSGGSGTTAILVRDAAGATFTVASGLSGTMYNWNYGILPPGTYSITVVRNGASSAATSFRINTPPTLKVTDPDETGGDDFATTVLGNPWDMTDSGDFRYDGGATIVDHLVARSASGGLFTGTSDGVTVGFAGSVPTGDPQLYVLSNGIASNTTAVIDTRRYHRLTFSLQVNRAFDLMRGSVARVFWGAATSPSGGGAPYTDLSITKDIITWPGMNTYSVDLAPLTGAADAGLEPAFATPWTARNVRHLRLDPFEFAERIDFHYGAVKLAADDESKNGSFTIRFTGSDADGDAASVALYYDTNLDPSSGLTLIASGVALSAGQFVWNTSQAAPGTYYVYAVASDGRNAIGRYSSGPVKVGGSGSSSNPLMSVDAPANGSSGPRPFTISGWAIDTGAPSGTGVDGIVAYADPGTASQLYLGAAAYGSARGDIGAAFGSRFANSGFNLTVNGLATGTHTLVVYAHSTATGTYNNAAVVTFTITGGTTMGGGGDFDGDSRSDITVYNTSSGVWSTLKSSTNYTTAMNTGWGGSGYAPVPGDYDGDGKADLAVYQQSTGNWYVLLSSTGFTTTLSKNAGGPGWIAVPGDYDGDRRTDLAVYNTSTGQWFALKSSTSYTTTLSIGWGGSGFTAAPGDFDGDGKTDLTVYRQSTGIWYALLSNGNYTTTISKGAGGSGYVPVQGDYDGDGRADFVVYHTSTGRWFGLKSSTGYTTSLSVAWGGTGYTPARGDFDGDGKLDLMLYQGSSGGWFSLLSGSGYTTSLSKNWGGGGYSPVPGFP